MPLYQGVGFTSWNNPPESKNGSAEHIPYGFSSVRHPESLKDRVAPEDIELIGWWPEVTHEEEEAIHLILRRISIVGVVLIRRP